MARIRIGTYLQVAHSRFANILEPTTEEAVSEEHNSDQGFNEFKPFSRLPIELRLAIWRLALPEPQIIEIKQVEHENPTKLLAQTINPDIQYPEKRCACAANFTPFSIFYVNRESRSFAMESYSLDFANRLVRPIWTDPKKDTILFPDIRALYHFLLPKQGEELIGPMESEKIGRLAIEPFTIRTDDQNFEIVQFRSIAPCIVKYVITFSKIKEIVLLNPKTKKWHVYERIAPSETNRRQEEIR